MTEEKWQPYSQTGVDGPEYGIRIRPGYVVVGFQKEDAEKIVSWQNASIRPVTEGDILERAKATQARSIPADHWNLLPELIAEVARLRSEMDNYGDDYVCQMKAQDARIKELEASIRQLGSLAFMGNKPLDQIIAHFIAWGQSNHEYTSRLEAAFLEAKDLEPWHSTCNCAVCQERATKARAALEEIRAGGKDER